MEEVDSQLVVSTVNRAATYLFIASVLLVGAAVSMVVGMEVDLWYAYPAAAVLNIVAVGTLFMAIGALQRALDMV